MRISDWSSDVCSSDLVDHRQDAEHVVQRCRQRRTVALHQPYALALDRVLVGVEHADQPLEAAAALRDQAELLGELFQLQVVAQAREPGFRQPELQVREFAEMESREMGTAGGTERGGK